MFLLALIQKLYADAPSDVRVLALFALWVSACGIVIAVSCAGRYLYAVHALSAPGGTLTTRSFKGPFAVLNLFAADKAARNTLSHDAVWDLVTTRLHMDFDARRATVRFLAYLPLLIGLAATMLGLAGMIDQLGREMSGAIRANLRGVFLGTLSGIVGSAIVGSSGLVLAATGRHALRRVEQYLYQHVLPTLPERRVALQIEEAVIQVIAERSQTVVNTMRTTLQPLATSLERSASESAKAATAAVEAFDHAVVVLRDSGDLRAAATIIGDKLKTLEQAAGQLGRAASSVQEATVLDASMRKSLSDAAAIAAQEADSLVQAGKGLDTQMATIAASFAGFTETTRAFATSAQSVGTEVAGAREAFTQLAHSVNQRNDVEKARIDSVHDRLTGLAAPLQNLHSTLAGISGEVANARAATERFRSEAADKLALNVDDNFKKLAAALEEVLAPIGRLVPGAANQLTLSSTQLQAVVDDAQRRVSELRAAIEPIQSWAQETVETPREIVAELREGNRLTGQVVDAVRESAQSAQSGHSVHSALSTQLVTSSARPAASGELTDAVREIKDAVASLHETLTRHARRSALRESRVGWFRRFPFRSN